MNNAHDLLEILRAAGLPISGFTIRDLEDVDTWTFTGVVDYDGPDVVTPAVRAQAVAIILEAIRPPPPKPDPLGDRVTTIESTLDELGKRVTEIEKKK